MDRTAVTNAAYAQYLLETNELAPAHWLGNRAPANEEIHPVVGVTLEQARAYANWRGARLPSQTEWMAAALGGENRPRPWGTECGPTFCQCPTERPTGTAPVDAHPAGASAHGVLGLYGNVWEWVEEAEDNNGSTTVFGGSYVPWSPYTDPIAILAFVASPTRTESVALAPARALTRRE